MADRRNIYLIYGTEGLLVENAVDTLLKRFAEEADLDYDLSLFDGESASADDIVATANTLPFLADHRLVVVRNADKLARDDQERLTGYAEDPAPFTALVLTGAKFAKNTRLYKAVERLRDRSFVKEYAPPSKGEYPQRVSDLFAQRGRRVSREATELMVRAVGYDLRRLAIEVDKAIAFVGERTTLGREDVEEVLSTSAATSVFDFLDALAGRDGRGALRLLGQLLDEGESVYGIHAMAVRQVRELVAAQSLAARGQAGSAALAAALGRQEWQVRRLPAYAKRFAPGEPAALIGAAAETEAKMKTSRDPRLAFERWVLRVCGV